MTVASTTVETMKSESARRTPGKVVVESDEDL
jgi:hypothetical protein